MSKILKNNRLLLGVIGVALLYNILLILVIKNYSWNNILDGMIINSSQVMLLIASFAMSQLFYNLFQTKIKVGVVTKIIAVLVPLFVLMVFYLFVNVFVGSTITIQLGFSLLIGQVIPDFRIYGFLLQANLFIIAKLMWFLYYTFLWVRFYLSALAFILVNRKKPQGSMTAGQTWPGSEAQANPLGSSSPSEPSDVGAHPLPSFCPHCGAAVIGTDKLCAVCGKPLVAESVPVTPPFNPYLQMDVPSTGLNVLAFFLPTVGLILYAVWSSHYPKKSKAVGKWALIGFICGIVGAILFYSFFFTYYMQFVMSQYS